MHMQYYALSMRKNVLKGFSEEGFIQIDTDSRCIHTSYKYQHTYTMHMHTHTTHTYTHTHAGVYKYVFGL